ncbi:unnamed protein product [Linum tenue]|uniref:Uncharacterized protein n=1 Tax=Linum tenue TaxID=586396 RepID=A0AAV0NCZ0_9ROSI|nr:unnamed protein product [Linum tenue]
MRDHEAPRRRRTDSGSDRLARRPRCALHPRRLIFPSVQPAPHRSFSEEVAALNEFFNFSEDGFSYAIYEAMRFVAGKTTLDALVVRVPNCFEPRDFSAAVTCRSAGAQLWAMDLVDISPRPPPRPPASIYASIIQFQLEPSRRRRNRRCYAFLFAGCY